MTVSPTVLATWLDRIRSEQLAASDFETAHPAIAADLKGLLEVATSIVPPPPIAMDPAVRALGRAALLSAIANEKPVVTNFGGWHFLDSIGVALMRPLSILARMERMPAFLVAIAILVVSTLVGGTVAAAGQALPGDVLYPVKLTVESVQVATAPSDAAKAEWEMRQASSRVAEINRAYQVGRTDAIASAAESYVQDVEAANQHLANAAAAGIKVDDLAKGMNSELAGQSDALESDEARAPANSQSALSAAALAARSGITVRDGSGATGSNGRGGTIPGTATPTSTSGGTIPQSPTATVGGTIPDSPTATATSSGTVPFATPTPTVGSTQTPEASTTPGHGGDNGGDGNGGDGQGTPTSVPPTTVVSSPTPRPTRPPEPTDQPEPTEKPQPTEVRLPTSTPQPTLAGSTPTPRPTLVREPTEQPEITQPPQATNTPLPSNGGGSATPKPTEATQQPTSTSVPASTPQPTSTSVPPSTPRPTLATTPRPTQISDDASVGR